MMIKNIILVIAVAATLIMVSCEGDTLELPVCNGPLIEINAIINNGLAYNSVFVKHAEANSMFIKGSAFGDCLKVEVAIIVNDHEIERGMTNKGRYYLKNNRFKVGDKVRVIVESDSLNLKATSECVVKEPVVVKNIRKEKVIKNKDTDARYWLTISEKEHDNKERFYRLSVYSMENPLDKRYDSDGNFLYWTFYEQTPYFNYFSFDHDISLNNGESRVVLGVSEEIDKTYGSWIGGSENLFAVFSNKYFENGEYTLCIEPELGQRIRHEADGPSDYFDVSGYYYYGNYNFGGWEHIMFVVSSISEEEYYFLRAMSLVEQYDGSDLFASNPPVLCSNFDGGEGIFAVESATLCYDLWVNVEDDDLMDLMTDSIAYSKNQFMEYFCN